MIVFDGLSDIGLERERQEDAIYQATYDKNTYLFIIADGSGMVNEQMNPAEIACVEVSNYVKRQYDHGREYLIQNADYIMEEALYTANRVLGAFHVVNEEKYSGFGCCMTACLVYDNKFTFSHSGNTRLHLIKANKEKKPVIIQLTADHTEGYEKLVLNQINEKQYLSGTDKLNLTSGLGIYSSPVIQTMTNKLKPGNIIVMTTDGIHYPLWQSAIMELTLKAKDTLSAAKALIDAAKIQQYPDNMSAMIVFSPIEGDSQQ